MMLLTTAEVAKLLRVSPRTVRLWAEVSELPALRIGGQWPFRSAVIKGLLADHIDKVGATIGDKRQAISQTK